MKKGLFFLSASLLILCWITLRANNFGDPVQSKKASIERGKKVYKDNCLACHQIDGSGVPMLNPPLQKTKWVLGNKKELITVVVKGMNEPIEINGESFSNTMPAHTTMTDQQIADVLTYVRNSFGNKASSVTAAEVKSVRSKMK